ncbi:hypothetical protein MKMG_01463 [Methanogenium sp. MK-MG]|nr:hypothetical protein MKMG_01463 [Methanogenium sp. MK-MG]
MNVQRKGIETGILKPGRDAAVAHDVQQAPARESLGIYMGTCVAIFW